MTDDARAELRRGVERLMRHAAAATAPVVRIDERGHFHRDRISVHLREEARVVRVTATDPPPLTPFQHLCLSGLLGDPDTLPQAVADYMLDQGHEYAAAVRDAERERCLRVLADYARYVDASEHPLRVLAELREHTASGFDPASPT